MLKEDIPQYASILQFDRETGSSEIFTCGVRITVGFDWHQKTGGCVLLITTEIILVKLFRRMSKLLKMIIPTVFSGFGMSRENILF